MSLEHPPAPVRNLATIVYARLPLAVGLRLVFRADHHDYLAAHMAIDSLVMAMTLCYDDLVWVA
jgi:hypothetical protein